MNDTWLGSGSPHFSSRREANQVDNHKQADCILGLEAGHRTTGACLAQHETIPGQQDEHVSIGPMREVPLYQVERRNCQLN